MFVAMPVLGRGPFNWSQTFPHPPQSSAQLVKYLGVDGSISADIGDTSYLFLNNALPNSNIGTIVDGNTMIGAASAPAPIPTTTTDPDFGTGNVILVEERGYIRESSPLLLWPTAMDSSKSFIVGGVLRVDEMLLDLTVDARDLFGKFYVASNPKGWRVIANLGDKNITAYTMQGSAGTPHIYCVSPIPLVLGEPIAIFLNLDIAAGVLKVMTSAAGSFASAAWVDRGDFQPSVTSAAFMNDVVGGFGGLVSQMWMLEYSASLDAGITEDNMTNFLKYYDGYLIA